MKFYESKLKHSFVLALFCSAFMGDGCDKVMGGTSAIHAILKITNTSSSLVMASGPGGHYTAGLPKTLTIQNVGFTNALNVTADISGVASNGLTASTCSSSLEPGDSCTITFNPGTAVPETTFPIKGRNTNQVNGTITILDYGSVYQSGYVYALEPYVFGATAMPADACNPETLVNCSKAAALANNSTVIAWDPTVLPSSTGALDLYNGSNILPDGNTGKIVAALGSSITYAARICANVTDGGFTDWYLPAICEMGPANNLSGCNAGTQNMVDNLLQLSPSVGNFAGLYWSSTEYLLNPSDEAWAQFFLLNSSGQGHDFKTLLHLVRCSRAITP